MANSIKGVSIKVHPLYFDNVFEINRKKLERKLKVSISQVKYTEYIAKKRIKQRLKKPCNKFTPKEFRRKKFYA